MKTMYSIKLLFRSLLFFLFLPFLGCKPDQIGDSAIEIPVTPTSAQSANLEEVFPDFEIFNINVPDSVFFGNVEQIKSDGNRIYLLDPFQSKSITILDKRGNFVNQLKRVGKGPGEYVSPYAFAIDNKKDELILYDRGKLEFITYKLPSLEYVGSKKRNALLMNFEVIDNGHLLAIRDDSRNRRELYGIEIWDREYKTLKDEVSDMRNAVIELSYHSTIGLNKKELLYVHPFTGLISRVAASGLDPIYDLSFEDWEVPQELYGMDEAVNFEEALTREKYVLWPRFPLESGGQLKLWYMYGADIDTYHLLIHDLQSAGQKSFSEIFLDEASMKVPMPLGIVDNFYASLIWPESIDPEDIPDKYAPIFEKSLSTELPILLYLK